VHSRYRTEAHRDVVGRFNERFLLSLISCPQCLIMDDELNVLPVSVASRNIVAVPPRPDGELTPTERELKDLKTSLKDTEPIGSLVELTKTLDQAKATLTFFEAISEKTLRSTVALTAARGRGKSAALGLAIASAVAFGYSNIFVTSPSPENLKTLFEFIFKGFDALGYKDHLDYEIVQSTNPEFNNSVVRVNIFKTHRQTIQYIQPTDYQKLGQAELLVIDEAAAIPLPIVKSLLGPYLVFIASTVNGYEGTGRSLSLKLIKQLKEQGTPSGSALSGRTFREVTLTEPIRYAAGDSVEAWLNALLCLDATIAKPLGTGCPHPDDCDLYYVNRDTLFSYHPISEKFLQRMMALYVSSHYKNSPNDLMLMSDAPAHHLFVLLPRVDETTTTLPEILCVIQVCLEGEISSETVNQNATRGQRPSGDLIPWTISAQFQDNDFPSLAGARIVRIATHPDYQRMGYGTRALQILQSYYEGRITNLSEANDAVEKQYRVNVVKEAAEETESKESRLLTEVLKHRSRDEMPPLLAKLSERRPEKLHYLGVSYGLTKELFAFWKRAGFAPVYIRLTPNELTGEHTCIMFKVLHSIHPLETTCASDWLDQFSDDFRRRFLSLLGYELRELSCELALSIISTTSIHKKFRKVIQKMDDILDTFSIHDIKRLESYAHNLLDYHVVIDLMPQLARFWFTGRLPDACELSPAQQLILLGLGLQHKTIDDIAKELNLKPNQVMALFNKAVRRLVQFIRKMEEGEELQKLPDVFKAQDVNMQPLQMSLEEEIDAAEANAKKLLEEKQKNLLDNLSLPEYAVISNDKEWETLPAVSKNKIPNIVSVKKIKRKLTQLSSNNTNNNDVSMGNDKTKKQKNEM